MSGCARQGYMNVNITVCPTIHLLELFLKGLVIILQEVLTHVYVILVDMSFLIHTPQPLSIAVH